MNQRTPKPFHILFAALACAAAARGEELHTFKPIQLNDQFWSEGANFGDFHFHDSPPPRAEEIPPAPFAAGL